MALIFALAQLNPVIGDLEGNAAQILTAAQASLNAGANVLITSELALCGYPPRDLLLDHSFIQACQNTLAQLQHELPPQLTAIIGTIAPNPDVNIGAKPLKNIGVVIQQGQVIHQFAKRLLPTYDVFDEDRYFASGTQASLFTLEQNGERLRLGLTICEDIWNDEEFLGKRLYPTNPIAELAQAQTDLIINLSASPYTVGKPVFRQALLAHTVQRYGCPIIYVNQVGGNDDLIFDGHSFALNHQAEPVSQAPGFQTAIEYVAWAKGKLTDHPSPLASDVPPQKLDKEAEIWAALVLGIQDYARKCGFSRAVVGLSGGIDSALVAALATAALGANQVLGVLMPSPYSSDHSQTDALQLVSHLGIHHAILPIADLMSSYAQTLAPLFTGTEPGVAEENIQARIRGNLLMAIANKFGYLLISTGNKSELAVGYCTLYGDMSGGLAAIADVPKTLVYELCHWLNKKVATGYTAPNFPFSGSEVIPGQILSKPPSAELRPGQLDQDSLPPYPILDDILHRFVDRHESTAEIIAAGHDPAVVIQVQTLVTRAEFKRHQAAPGLKITSRAFGTGWRMPIAARRTFVP